MVGLINSLASNAYSAVNRSGNSSGVAGGDSVITGRSEQLSDPFKANNNFQSLVHKNFNSFAGMSSEQILAKIRSPAAPSKSFAGNIISNVRAPLENYERTSLKQAIGKASLLDLLQVTSQAKHTIQAMVSIRDQALQAFKDITNMPL